MFGLVSPDAVTVAVVLKVPCWVGFTGTVKDAVPPTGSPPATVHVSVVRAPDTEQPAAAIHQACVESKA